MAASLGGPPSPDARLLPARLLLCREQALALLGLRTGRRYLSVRVDDVFAAANHHMRSEPARATVESALGEFWQPGKFRGYAMESFEEAVKGRCAPAARTLAIRPAGRTSPFTPPRLHTANGACARAIGRCRRNACRWSSK